MQKPKPIVLSDKKVYDLTQELEKIITSMEITAGLQKIAMQCYEDVEPSDYTCRLLYKSTSIYNAVLMELIKNDLDRAESLFQHLNRVLTGNSKGDSAGEVKAYD